MSSGSISMTHATVAPRQSDTKQRIEDALRENLGPNPEWLRSYNVELGWNQYDEPAVFITALVQKDDSPSKTKIWDMLRLAERMERIVDDVGLALWAYVRYAEKK